MRALRLVLAGLLLLGGRGAHATTQLSIDDLLRLDGIGEVEFDRAGTSLAIERYLPVERQSTFETADTRLRSSTVVLRRQARLFEKSFELRGSLGHFSSDGRYLSVLTVSKDGSLDGSIIALNRQSALLGKVLGVSVAPLPHENLAWLSDDRLLVVRAANPTAFAHPRQLALETARTLSHRTWNDSGAAVSIWHPNGSAIGWNSGKGRLVIWDKGKQVEALAGNFVQSQLGDDGRLLVAVERMAIASFRPHTVIQPTEDADFNLQLACFDLSTMTTYRLPLAGRSVIAGSVRASPHSAAVFFQTRSDITYKVENWVYNVRGGILRAFDPSGLSVLPIAGSVEALTPTYPMVWLNGRPAVYARHRTTGTIAGRADWFAMTAQNTWQNLTARLAAAPTDFIAADNERLYFLSGNALWSLDLRGPHELFKLGRSTLSPLCIQRALLRNAGSPPRCSVLSEGGLTGYRPTDTNNLDGGWLAFERTSKNPHVLVVNVRTGRSFTIPSPKSAVGVLTVSASAQAAVFLNRANNVDSVEVVFASGDRQELLRSNEALRNVEIPVVKRVSRISSGRRLFDYLILPCGYRTGRRYSLIADIYPGPVFSQNDKPDVRATDAINPFLLACHGYMVVLPSIPLNHRASPGFSRDIAREVVSAAENVNIQGYADRENWILIGHSYGGYGVLEALLETRRFKAAIAMSPAVNLTSVYGARSAMYGEGDVSTGVAWGVGWLETGQGAMDGPPWRVPDNYVKNSPLFGADKIVTPLLLMSGTMDVSSVEAEQMYNALQRQGRDVTLIQYWGEGHVLQSPANIRDYWRRVWHWLDGKIGGSPVPAMK